MTLRSAFSACPSGSSSVKWDSPCLPTQGFCVNQTREELRGCSEVKKHQATIRVTLSFSSTQKGKMAGGETCTYRSSVRLQTIEARKGTEDGTASCKRELGGRRAGTLGLCSAESSAGGERASWICALPSEAQPGSAPGPHVFASMWRLETTPRFSGPKA